MHDESSPIIAGRLVENPAILLAEDNDNDVFFMRRAIAKAGIRLPVVVLRNGEQVMSWLQGGRGENENSAPYNPCLLLLDLKMPLMDGFEVLTWIRAQPLIRRLPVVILTSSRQDPDIQRAYDLGANSYLVKPPQYEELVVLMEAIQTYWIALCEKPALTGWEGPDKLH